jgi:hypothetical protein
MAKSGFGPTNDSIWEAAFTAADSDGHRGLRGRPGAGRLSDASSQVASADLCGANSASADALIERIERAVEPNAAQRDAREQLDVRWRRRSSE